MLKWWTLFLAHQRFYIFNTNTKFREKELKLENCERDFSSLDIYGYKSNGYNPSKKELAMCFQVLKMLKSKIEELQGGYQDVGKICCGNCNIF